MKPTTLMTGMLHLLVAVAAGITIAQAQAQTPAPTPKPSPTPYVKQKLTPKATMKGVGTQKIVKGTKNILREGESFAGRSARKVGKEASKDSRKVKNSLSQDIRKVQNALGGHKKPKTTPTPPPAP
jgi:hypothetical protein